jgi:hypothetical protein
VTSLFKNLQWAEAWQRDFANRTGAVIDFWPSLKQAFRDLIDLEPAKGHVILASQDENPHLFVVTAGVFDLKLAADALSDTVFYAFTSSTLKRLIPTESEIYHYGQLKLTRGIWGIIDGPGEEVHRVFAEDPHDVAAFPLADRFAQWALEQLLAGYPAIVALEEAAADKAAAEEHAAHNAAERGETKA